MGICWDCRARKMQLAWARVEIRRGVPDPRFYDATWRRDPGNRMELLAMAGARRARRAAALMILKSGS